MSMILNDDSDWGFKWEPSESIDLMCNGLVSFIGTFRQGPANGLWFTRLDSLDNGEWKTLLQPQNDYSYKATMYYKNDLFEVGYGSTPINAILDCFHFAGIHVDPNEYNLNPVVD